MGCDIHTIIEIKNNGKWEYIPDLPLVFDQRSYGVFSILNKNVRNSTGKDGFEGKGLPNDLSGRQFRFVSHTAELESIYNGKSVVMCCIGEDKYINAYTEMLRIEISRELFEELVKDNSDTINERYYLATKSNRENKYYVQDAQKVNGKFVNIPYNKLYKTLKEFNDAYYRYPWVEKEQDYGYYEVDFDSNDFHSASYLTLKELKTKMVFFTPENSFVVPKQFIDYLKEEFGELPETMDVKDKNPYEVIVSFDVDTYSVCAQNAYNDGVQMIQAIKEKYNVENDDDIRIVFAFDS